MNRVHARSWQGMKDLFFLAILLAALMTPAATAVAALEYNERVPLRDEFDTCAGERVLINGVQHIVGRFTTDAAGRQHFGFTRNTYGTGTGQTSGATYRLIDSVSRASLEVPATGVITYSEGYNSRLLRQGEGAANDDTQIHFLTHITINANGEVTAAVEIQKVVCQ